MRMTFGSAGRIRESRSSRIDAFQQECVDNEAIVEGIF